jgi:hypothetical protein
MEWVKAITELIKALAPFAWPALVGLIVWWFRKEIRTEVAALIARISKVKGPGGFELEIREVRAALENTKAAIPEAIEQVKTVLAHATVTTSASVKVNLVEGLQLLNEIAAKDPREAIRRSWKLLAKTILRTANVPSESFEPLSADVSRAIGKLESNTEFSEALIRSIKNLQEIARKVFYQSQFGYDPSQEDAEEFVLYSAAARTDLGDEVK